MKPVNTASGPTITIRQRQRLRLTIAEGSIRFAFRPAFAVCLRRQTWVELTAARLACSKALLRALLSWTA